MTFPDMENIQISMSCMCMILVSIYDVYFHDSGRHSMSCTDIYMLCMSCMCMILVSIHDVYVHDTGQHSMSCTDIYMVYMSCVC